MTQRIGSAHRGVTRLAPLVVAVAMVGGLLALGGPAEALTNLSVISVTGNAYGVSAPDISLFGGAQTPFAPAPTITLPSGGSTTLSATAPSEDVTYGPATFFDSGTETVTTTGKLGAKGSATSTAAIAGETQPAGTCPGTETTCVSVGPFSATSVASNCKATLKAASGKTALVGGQLVTATDTNGNPTKTVLIVASPKKNFTVKGFLYAGPTDKETFTFVFNQQTINANGSVTVTAGHEELLGPTAKGDVYFGQSVCGITT